ncbi:transcription-repair coupling factor [Eubacteriaceae bacterium ES3]|nr:transcription-repair coupling factor [Eubacteriaceae bacterium ES3]
MNLKKTETFKNIKNQLQIAEPLNLTGVNKGFKAALTAALEENEQLLYITMNDIEALKVEQDLKRTLGDQVLYFPMEPIHDYFADVHSREITNQRLLVLKKILTGQPCLVVTGVETIFKKFLPREDFVSLEVSLAQEDEIAPDLLIDKLVQLGYERDVQVEARGQFAHRGGIIDVFVPSEEYAYRLEFFGETIESIRSFDPQTQLSVENHESVSITAAREVLLPEKERELMFKRLNKKYRDEALYQPLLERLTEEGCNTCEILFALSRAEGVFFDYFKDPLIIWDEPTKIRQAGNAYLEKLDQDILNLGAEGILFPEEKNKFFRLSKIEKEALSYREIKVNLFGSRSKKGTTIEINALEIEPFVGAIPRFLDFVEERLKKDYLLEIHVRDEAGRKRIEEILVHGDIHRFTENFEAGIQLLDGEIAGGFELTDDRLICLNERDIIRDGSARRRRRRKKGKKLDSFTQLNQGDYVVHDIHGIGIYKGIEQLTIDETIKDLMVIEYANDAKFYCPVDQMDAVQVYVGTGEKKPRVNQLGTSDWNKSKSRVKAAVEEMADELIDLYAKRQKLTGYAFGPDTTFQQEFEDAFPYEETGDQLQAVEEIKEDMEKAKPMDRLLCGDVGYGKTEVALRAVFKAVMDGKQVAFLVPTTILAQQHYQTIIERFANYPVRIGLLSRFKTKSEQEKTMRGLISGEVDLVVGTHRLLSKDVQFKDLGLLVIDEEQRFGVTHKEKIKQMKENIDVLTLSATPIPRTLHMSMIGVRDMSVIDEPPEGRRPVLTYVMEYNDALIKDAIEKELKRRGQVYFVHNRVNDIYEVSARLRELVPGLRITVAHGQMSGPELEDIMMDFLEYRYDLLVTTTIIESGLDIKNANTLIIDNGDHMGLSQLYQLRGRVGRSNVQGYAYVTHKQKMLSEVSQKRLKAIKDFTAFGSGFKIALRDLEIRGAGNILGSAQSGNLASIGYELYCRILDEAVNMRLGKALPEPGRDVLINLDISSYIPETYIKDEELKYDLYKKLSYIKTREDYNELEDELLDRFGAIPDGVYNLMALAMIKFKAKMLGMIEVSQRGNSVSFTFDPEVALPIPQPESMEMFGKTYSLKFNAGKKDEIKWRIVMKKDVEQRYLNKLGEFFDLLEAKKIKEN